MRICEFFCLIVCIYLCLFVFIFVIIATIILVLCIVLGVAIFISCIFGIYIFKVSTNDKYNEEGKYDTFSKKYKAAYSDTSRRVSLVVKKWLKEGNPEPQTGNKVRQLEMVANEVPINTQITLSSDKNHTDGTPNENYKDPLKKLYEGNNLNNYNNNGFNDYNSKSYNAYGNGKGYQIAVTSPNDYYNQTGKHGVGLQPIASNSRTTNNKFGNSNALPETNDEPIYTQEEEDDMKQEEFVTPGGPDGPDIDQMDLNESSDDLDNGIDDHDDPNQISIIAIDKFCIFLYFVFVFFVFGCFIDLKLEALALIIVIVLWLF